MPVIEKEKITLVLRRRFIRLHGEKKWIKLQRCLYNSDLNQSELSVLLDVSYKTIRYWKSKMKWGN